ncbi:MAG: hypothetical protein WCQ53_05540 [bacterium]
MKKHFFALASVSILYLVTGMMNLYARDDSNYYYTRPVQTTTVATTTTSTCVDLTAQEIECLGKMQTVVTNANPYDTYSWGGARGTLLDLSKTYAPCRTLRQKCSQLEPQDMDQAKSPVKYKAHFLAEAAKIQAALPKAKTLTAIAADANDKTLDLKNLEDDNCILFKGQLTAGQVIAAPTGTTATATDDSNKFYAHCRTDMANYTKVAKFNVYDCGTSTSYTDGDHKTLSEVSGGAPAPCTKLANLDYIGSCALKPRYSATANCDYECYLPTTSKTVTKRLYYSCACAKTSSKKLADLYYVVKQCTPTYFY